mmetsp:Transcript_20695/g.37068  ORF Transcript_20695/g.37068 Transcript_20695/m.37068 type:complete len:225 (+) Transcript_20695:924-1598(+)
MLTLSKLLVQTPENLDDGKGGRGDGIGEITTGGRDGTNDGDATLTTRATQALNATSTLVERSKTSGEVSRITGISRHLSKTTGNLTKSLSPTRGGVTHHREVITHITEILGESNTSVDRRLTGSNGHIGSVGDQASTLHDRLLTTIRESHSKSRELHENFSHLITTLTATDVDNAIGVRELGQGLGNDSLSATKSTRNRASSTKNRGKKSIKNTLTSKKRGISN